MKKPKEIFATFIMEDGWIEKYPEEIAFEWEEDSVLRLDLEKELNGYFHANDKEFESDEFNSKYRFI